MAGGAASAVTLIGCGGDTASAPAQEPSPEQPQPEPSPSQPAEPEPTQPEPSPQPADPRVVALQTFLDANRSADFLLPAPATDVPVISWAGLLSASTPATTLANGVVHPITDPLISKPIADQLSQSLPGNPLANGLPCLSVSRPYSCKGNARTIGSVRVLRFKTDAAVIELTGVVADGSTTQQTLWIDGRLVPTTALSSSRGSGGGWNLGTVRIAFPSRRLRDIWVETGLALAYLKVDQGDSLVAVGDEADPQITVIGDSYLQVGSSNFANGAAIALELAARLGLRKLTTDAIGGTGYWNSGANLGNLNDRLPAHAADGSQIYLVLSGLNDYGDFSGSGTIWPSRTVYEQSVLGYLQALRAAQPDALIVATAPFCPIPPMSDSTYVSNSNTNSSGTGDFLYKANLVKQSIQQIAAPWIYIDVLMGGGWLNSSGATGDITNLQWLTGGTAGPGTTAAYKPGNTLGGAGGGFGGVASIPIVSGGNYAQAPEITATGGSGSGLLLASRIDGAGALTEIRIVAHGNGYTTGTGLPSITIDATFQNTAATLGTPTLIGGVNLGGRYPLLSFAPPGVTEAQLHNIDLYLSADTTHPSVLGVDYLSKRLAENIYQAVMTL